MRRSSYRYVWLLFLLLALAVDSYAEAARRPRRIPDRCAYWQGAVGTEGAGKVVSFADATNFGADDSAFMVRLQNKDTADSLTWEEIPYRGSVALSPLSTPTAGVVSDHSRLDPSDTLEINNIRWIGVTLQNEDDASDDQGTIQSRVDFCW